MRHYVVSACTASGDTVKTLVDTVQFPQGTKAIVGVGAYALGGAGETTLENITGIIELESVDLAVQPFQFPIQPCAFLTSGGVSHPIQMWPMDIVNPGPAKISCYVTMDMALTVNSKVRLVFAIEV
jgi:hypothetical protein